MPQPETQTSPAERVEAAPSVQAFVENADDVRKALGLPDAAERWKELLETVASDLPSPDEAKVGSVMRMELVRRYQTLSDDRFRVAKALNAVLSFAQADQPIDSVLQAAVLRALGQYIDQRDVYAHMIAGKVPSGTPLPEYLSKYVSTREEEQVAVNVTGYMLPLQYDVRDAVGLTDSPQVITPLAKEVAMGAVRLKLRMNHVLQCAPGGVLATDDASYETLLEAAGFRPNGTETIDRKTLDAAKFFVAYLLKYRTDIQKYADVHSAGALDTLTIAEALECAAQASALGDLVREVSLNAKGLLSMDLPDMRQFVKTMFEDGALATDRMLRVALAPLATLEGANGNPEKFEENAKAVIAFYRSTEADSYSVGRLDAYVHHFNDAQRRMIMALANRVSGPEHAGASVDRLLRAAFIPTDASEQDDVEKRIAEKLRSLIGERTLSASDAFDVYYLFETKGSDVLLAYKVVHILDSYGEQDLATELQLRLLRRLVDVATSSDEEFDELAEQFQLSDENRTELENVRRYLSESGVNALEHWYQRLWSFNVNFPEIAIPLEIFSLSSILVPLSMAGWRIYITLNVGKLEKFANMGAAEARVFLRLPASVTDNQIRLAQREVTEILGEYDRLGRRFHLFRGRKLLRQSKAIVRSASAAELETLANALKSRYANAADVAERLAVVSSDETAIRTALQRAGFAEADVTKALESISAGLAEHEAFAIVNSRLTAVEQALAERRLASLRENVRGLSKELDDILVMDDIAARRTALDAWVGRAKTFQADANELSKMLPNARRLLAQEAVGTTLLTDDAWQVVERMHAAQSMEDKMRMLVEAELPPAQHRAVKKLARLGIAGETDAAVGILEAAEAVPATAKQAGSAPKTRSVRGSPTNKPSKVGGHAGYLLMELTTASELLSSLDQTAKAGPLDELASVGAASELWHSADLAVNGGSGPYSPELQKALTIAQSTGGEAWVRDEAEIARQWDQLLVMRTVLGSQSVPDPVPALRGEAMRLERRRLQLLDDVRALIDVRSRQFPVYQPTKPLTEQLFTRDGRSEGTINVNTSGHFFIFPVPFRNGPIARARAIGAKQRTKDGFDRKEARAEFENMRDEIWYFQGEIEVYLQQLESLEQAKGE